jgi:hypothetical protein
VEGEFDDKHGEDLNRFAAATCEADAAVSKWLGIQSLAVGSMEDTGNTGLASREVPGSFTSGKCLLVKEFIPSGLAASLVPELLAGRARRVTVGAKDEWWTEYSIDTRSRLGRILTGADAMKLVHAGVEAPSFLRAQLWGQAYELGQRIALHTDAEGDVQLLLCLEQPPAECGGYLILKPGEGEVRLRLEPGDALLFRATDIPHATTPIIPSQGAEAPRRTVAVARFLKT